MIKFGKIFVNYIMHLKVWYTNKNWTLSKWISSTESSPIKWNSLLHIWNFTCLTNLNRSADEIEISMQKTTSGGINSGQREFHDIWHFELNLFARKWKLFAPLTAVQQFQPMINLGRPLMEISWAAPAANKSIPIPDFRD